MERRVPETTVASQAPPDHEGHSLSWFRGYQSHGDAPATCAQALRDQCQDAGNEANGSRRRSSIKSRAGHPHLAANSALRWCRLSKRCCLHDTAGRCTWGGCIRDPKSRKEGCAGCLTRVTEPPDLDVVSELSAVPPDHPYPRAIPGHAQLPALPGPRRAANADVHVGGPAPAHPRCRRARGDCPEAERGRRPAIAVTQLVTGGPLPDGRLSFRGIASLATWASTNAPAAAGRRAAHWPGCWRWPAWERCSAGCSCRAPPVDSSTRCRRHPHRRPCRPRRLNRHPPRRPARFRS
jgi:hypothetical protein